MPRNILLITLHRRALINASKPEGTVDTPVCLKRFK